MPYTTTTLSDLQTLMAQRWDQMVSGLPRCGAFESPSSVSFGVACLLTEQFARLAEMLAGVSSADSAEERRTRKDLVAAPALLVCGVLEQRGVQRPMFCWRGQDEVLRPVVRPVVINVMHDLLARQGSAEDLAHDQPVLKDGDAVDRKHLVAVREAPAPWRSWAYAGRIAGLRPALPVPAAPAACDGGPIAVGDATEAG